jgi:hypothetical protein
MQRVTLTDFIGGMVERISPDDYNKGEWTWLEGFVPENDRTIRSQWALQSIGNYGPGDAEGGAKSARNWLAGGIDGNIDTSDVISVYPLRASTGVYLVAIKANGTLWWTKAPAGNAPYTDANACVWKRIGYRAADGKCYAVNKGFSIYSTYDNQPDIEIENNPDYRFITELPFEVYKYIKEPQDAIRDSGGTILVNGSHVPAANPPVADWTVDFTKDALPDTTTSLNDLAGDEANPSSIAGQTGFPRSIVSAVLIHSRRYYQDGVLTNGKNHATKRTVTRYQVTLASGVYTAKIWFTAGTLPVFVVGDDISVNGIPHANLTGSFIVTGSGNDGNGDFVTFTTKTNTVTATNNTNPDLFAFKKYRTQTAVIAYVDPYTQTVRATTFPNFRRWPMYTGKKTQADLFKAEYRPMPIWGVSSARDQLMYPFLDRYPFANGTITGPMIQDQPADTTNWPDDANVGSAGNYSANRSAFPQLVNSFHPYTYLNNDKTMLPGRGLIPRAFAGTMFGSLLILGDIEWKEDSSGAYLNEKRLIPKKNHTVVPTSNSNFGLRDGNTEPHRGFFYYSQDDIDVFDPRSVLRASGTDTRIAGMHTLNNRVISITTAGGPEDGIVSFSGNFGALHPYTPGVLANPLAVRKELILGGVGTADAADSYNHGNPQSCLWPEFGRVAFIDKTGYVYTTDGAQANLLDERYPLIGRAPASTVNDHVAAVGKFLFIYQSGYLFCYTITNGRGAWYLIKRPEAWWQVRTEGSGPTRQYNVIRSMRGAGNELYFVVHSYWLPCDANYQVLPDAEPVLGSSRVMRLAMDCDGSERGHQDGYELDSLDVVTPVLGVTNQSKKIFWRMVGINFVAPSVEGCSLVGAGAANTSFANGGYPGIPSGDDHIGFGAFPPNTASYTQGYFQTPFPNMSASYVPSYSAPLKTYNGGYHNFEMSAGLGPQRNLMARFSFRGDVAIEGVNIFFTGNYDLLGDA